MPISLRTNRLALLLVFSLALPIAAHADDASHRAKVHALMAQLHTEQNVRQIADGIMKQISDAADKSAAANPTPEQKAKLDDLKKQAAQVIDQQIGWKAMQDSFADVYAKNFTDEQLDAIMAFYNSPAGVALLTNMPAVNSQIDQLGKARMKTLLPQLQQLFADYQKSSAPPAPPTLSPATPAKPAHTAPSSPK